MSALIRLNNLPTVSGLSDEGVKKATFYFVKVFAGLRPHTQKAYRSDFEKYSKFMAEYRPGIPAFTSDVDTMRTNIMAYVDYLLSQGFKRTTINRNLNIISQVSNSMMIPNPYRDDRDFRTYIGNTISNGLSSAHRAQALPVTAEIMRAVCKRKPIDDLTLRNQVMANLAWDTLCRASEIGMAKWVDIDWNEGTLLIPQSKSNKTGELDYRFLSQTTLTGLSQLKAATPSGASYLFNPLTNTNGILISGSKNGLSYTSVVQGLRSALRFGGVARADDYTGHSFRVGAALDMKRNNLSDGLIQASGGWKDSTMPSYYTRKLETAQSGSARLAQIHNR